MTVLFFHAYPDLLRQSRLPRSRQKELDEAEKKAKEEEEKRKVEEAAKKAADGEAVEAETAEPTEKAPEAPKPSMRLPALGQSIQMEVLMRNIRSFITEYSMITRSRSGSI